MNNLCPLFEPLPTCDDSELEPQIRHCIKVIEKARELWNCFPQSDKNKYPTWKLDSAQAIWNLCPENDLFSIPLDEAIGKVKIFSSPKIDDRITDYQIYAIFVIYKICLVLHYLSKPEYKDSHDVRRLLDDATKSLSLAIKVKEETQVQDNSEFVYNHSKQCLVLNDMEMSLKGKMKDIVKVLEKRTRIEWILSKYYKENCKKGEKIIDSKRGTFDKAVHDLNNKWYKTFKVSKELITSDNNGTYYLTVKIKW